VWEEKKTQDSSSAAADASADASAAVVLSGHKSAKK
jgi:hypothetical protein